MVNIANMMMKPDYLESLMKTMNSSGFALGKAEEKEEK